MKLGGIGPVELIVILLIALVIFGPKNLPKLGAALGKTVRNIRAGMDEVDEGTEQPSAEAKKIEGVAADQAPTDASETQAADDDTA